MTARLAFAGAAIAALALAGCSGIDNGVVVGKAYHGPYTYVNNVIMSDGKTVTMYPQIVDVPECWGLLLRDGPIGDEDTVEGEKCVTPEVYGPMSVGDYYQGNGS